VEQEEPRSYPRHLAGLKIPRWAPKTWGARRHPRSWPPFQALFLW